MSLRLLLLVLGLVASTVGVSFGAQAPPTSPAGTYRLTVRQCDGPLADAYVPGSTIQVRIASDNSVTVDGSTFAMTVNGADLESGPLTQQETRGKRAGLSVIKNFSFHIENNVAVGGTALYVIDDLDGRTKSGSILFTLTRIGN
jgi:hypothetical protein